MGEKLTHAMEPHNVFTMNLFGLKIPVSDLVVTMWVIMAVMIILAVFLTRKLTLIPNKRQNIAEIVVEFINNMVKDAIGPHYWKAFAPYLGTVILFLIFANTVSIFNIIPGGEEGFKLRPPTRNINVTLCLAVMSICVVIYAGIRYKGVGGWLKSFAKPTPVMLPFNILDYLIKPASLALRLFGNILGAFIVMELIYMALPVFAPAFLSLYFDLFDGILQAYVFMFLTSIYISEALE
ncbi:F-type H+-transporting ATPase subunit a [Ruminiclostridium sufflavum DSM 19573]|uniref:ATP synthase subunit a n=1 Tax=Ruminiclostridium sufflavum DSM 19573 TaxID=1121337 RepID=A0A318YAQ0_9FIRM|nr:F0F1 ATP synthase subunit A [Ruminiclostridium sufflavum]PYG89533.1 F-type H+-transporting ATPase subunit a [Ruminiclostridium sufflavum DSM 19573]